MNSSLIALIGLSAAVVVAAGSPAFAAGPQDTPPMHMHKSDMDHDKPDQEIAAEYKSEAAQLREKAASHRKLAQVYKHRTLPKGTANFATIAKHCENLANYYEQAAKEAEAVSAELAK